MRGRKLPPHPFGLSHWLRIWQFTPYIRTYVLLSFLSIYQYYHARYIITTVYNIPIIVLITTTEWLTLNISNFRFSYPNSFGPQNLFCRAHLTVDNNPYPRTYTINVLTTTLTGRSSCDRSLVDWKTLFVPILVPICTA